MYISPKFYAEGLLRLRTLRPSVVLSITELWIIAGIQEHAIREAYAHGGLPIYRWRRRATGESEPLFTAANVIKWIEEKQT